MKPVKLQNINWDVVIKRAEKVIDGLDIESYYGDDSEHYIFEEVMRAIFGQSVFKYMIDNYKG